jgi:hypothetical protein
MPNNLNSGVQIPKNKTKTITDKIANNLRLKSSPKYLVMLLRPKNELFVKVKSCSFPRWSDRASGRIRSKPIYYGMFSRGGGTSDYKPIILDYPSLLFCKEEKPPPIAKLFPSPCRLRRQTPFGGGAKPERFFSFKITMRFRGTAPL